MYITEELLVINKGSSERIFSDFVDIEPSDKDRSFNKCWGDNGIVSDAVSSFVRNRRGSRELIICWVGVICCSVCNDEVIVGVEYTRWYGTRKWLGYFVVGDSIVVEFCVDSCGGPSQTPELDVIGVFEIKGVDFLGGFIVFFFIDFPPLVIFPLRCWDSWVNVGINSGGNLSIRSYHRIAIGKICGGWEIVSKFSCS